MLGGDLIDSSTPPNRPTEEMQDQNHGELSTCIYDPDYRLIYLMACYHNHRLATSFQPISITSKWTGLGDTLRFPKLPLLASRSGLIDHSDRCRGSSTETVFDVLHCDDPKELCCHMY